MTELINPRTFDHAGIQCVSYEEPDGVYTWFGCKFGKLVVATGDSDRNTVESVARTFFDNPLAYLESVRSDYDEGDPPEELAGAIADAKQRIEEALAAYKTMGDRYAAAIQRISAYKNKLFEEALSTQFTPEWKSPSLVQRAGRTDRFEGAARVHIEEAHGKILNEYGATGDCPPGLDEKIEEAYANLISLIHSQIRLQRGSTAPDKFAEMCDRYGSDVASQIWTEETIGRD